MRSDKYWRKTERMREYCPRQQKNPLKFNGFSYYFVEITGLEPATFRLRT